ncbi:MAG: hypothetical protein JGK30_20475 [Microcoleus sp. PH2017_40_RAT_O_B]|uniref:hypothetical protein n=1 Tax=unclassified Microcoleus TaxID=2642155 RepID=UPI001DF3342A|nr:MULTISPECIES: hypothetical protein [unclassified Microcoleus]MCC3574257.1 hypothetical protein [Microcoleus sp. PH2017_34_RAT_O_A]MCC3611785.1 hypothetical protein [Microcoleus sp. PH2017_40_RAT_O_B]
MSKNCYLTGKGLQKVQTAAQGYSEQNCLKSVNKPFPENVNLSELERVVGQQRETLKKILYRTHPVNKKSLDDLFTALSIDLEESDYENRGRDHKNATSTNQRVSANTQKVLVEQVTQVIASDNGIPKVIRRSSQNRRNL